MIELEPPPRPLPLPAFRRPGAVLALYAVHVAAALWLALQPAALAARVTSGQPLGDRVLFEPGGVLLVEALRLARPSLPWLGLASALSVVAFAFAELVPIGALLAALARRGRVTPSTWLRDGVAHLGTLALLEGVAIAAQVLAVAVALAIGTSVASTLQLAPPAYDLVLAGSVVAGIVVAIALRLVHDLARVGAVDEGRGLHASVGWAFRVTRRRGLRALGSFAWRAALGSVLLVAAAYAAPPTALGASLVVHALAVLAVVYLRADWLGIALGISRDVVRADRIEPEPSEARAPESPPSERSAERSDSNA
jgi:hypothetical protein